MTSKRQRACSGRRGRVLPVDGPAPGLLCCTMQRELAALQSQLAALQRPGGDAGRFAGACFAISQRLEAHGKGSRPAKARNLIRLGGRLPSGGWGAALESRPAPWL